MRLGSNCLRRTYIIETGIEGVRLTDAFRNVSPWARIESASSWSRYGQNVLAATRQPWLVIDPKPLRGEREFSLPPIIRSFELGHSERATRCRLDRLTAEIGLDRDRALGWAVAQTMAWSFGSGYRDHHHETTRWLLRSR